MKKLFHILIIGIMVLGITGCKKDDHYGCYDSDNMTLCLYKENDTKYFKIFEKDTINANVPASFETLYCINELKGTKDSCSKYDFKNLTMDYYEEKNSGYLNLKNNEFIITDIGNTDGTCEIKDDSLLCNMFGKEVIYKKSKNETSFYENNNKNEISKNIDTGLINMEEYNLWVKENEYCKTPYEDSFKLPESIKDYDFDVDYYNRISKTYTKEYFNSEFNTCILFNENNKYIVASVKNDNKILSVKEIPLIKKN